MRSHAHSVNSPSPPPPPPPHTHTHRYTSIVSKTGYKCQVDMSSKKNGSTSRSFVTALEIVKLKLEGGSGELGRGVGHLLTSFVSFLVCSLCLSVMASGLLDQTGDILETRMDDCCRILHTVSEEKAAAR